MAKKKLSEELDLSMDGPKDLDDEMMDLDRFLDEEAEPLMDDEEAVSEMPEEASEAANETIAALNDRLMRALADAENQRKRGERDRRDAEVYGGRKLARDLLSVYDNLKRAMDTISDEQREANKGLIEGIDLTAREMLNVFASHQITPLKPEVGEKFDPELHQAMFEAPFPDVPKGHIIQVMSDGFVIADRLLRPAQVGVSSGG